MHLNWPRSILPERYCSELPPYTAMVFVWSKLTNGNPAYTVVQVATNDLIIPVAFVSIVKFFLGVSNVTVPYSTLFLSVFLFVVIPLVAGIVTRTFVIAHKGKEYLENIFVHQFDNATTIGLLLTLISYICISGRGYSVLSFTYPSYCCATHNTDISYLLHRIWRI